MQVPAPPPGTRVASARSGPRERWIPAPDPGLGQAFALMTNAQASDRRRQALANSREAGRSRAAARVISEEVNEVMPELVVRDAAGQIETVAYHELPALLLNELQKQHATIAAQQAQIDELRQEVKMVLARMEAARPAERSTR